MGLGHHLHILKFLPSLCDKFVTNILIISISGVKSFLICMHVHMFDMAHSSFPCFDV